MKLLIFLLFSHFLADVFIRNNLINKHKDNIYILLFHCFLWACSVSVVLEIYSLWMLEKFLFLFVGHVIIDFIKCRMDTNKNWEKDGKPDISRFKIVDQIAHLIQILIVWIW